MRQVIEDALGNRQVIILNDDVDVGCQIDGEAAAARLGQISVIGKCERRRATRLWIGAALLATVWASEARSSSEELYPQADARAHAQLEILVSEPEIRGPVGAFGAESALSSGLTGRSVRLAQAAPDNPEDVQKALEQEHNRAELLARELTIHRHLEMLLTLNRARTEGASFRQLSEGERTEFQEHLEQERARLKQAAESGATELCRVLSGGQLEWVAGATDLVALRTSLQQEHERSDRLEQDLAAARHNVAMQTALASRTNEEAGQAKGKAQGEAAEPIMSLQQERERAAQLEKDLGAARSDVATQTALVSRAHEEARQAKQSAENAVAELKTSLQKEHERAEALARNLSMVHTAVYTYEVQARMANDQAAARAQSASGSAAELRKLLQQEQARTAQLEKLVASRREVKRRRHW